VVRAEQTSNRKLGFDSLGGLDDPSWDAQNSDFGPKGVSGDPNALPAPYPSASAESSPAGHDSQRVGTEPAGATPGVVTAPAGPTQS
jgi:hypothetical protein